MINGVKPTQIQLVRHQLSSHYKKLQQISGKKFLFIQPQLTQYKNNNDWNIEQDSTAKQHVDPLQKCKSKSLQKSFNEICLSSHQRHFALLSQTQKQRLRKKKQNHIKSYSYHKLKKQLEIEYQNNKIYQKLLKIQQRKAKGLVNDQKAYLFAVQNGDNQDDQGIQGKGIGCEIIECKGIERNTKGNEGKSIGDKQTKTIGGKIISSKTQKKSIQKIQQKSPPKRMGKDFVYRKRQSLAIQATNIQFSKRLLNKTGYYDHHKDLQNFNKTRQILQRLGRFSTVNRLLNPSPKRSKTLPNKLPKLYTQQSVQQQKTKAEL